MQRYQHENNQWIVRVGELQPGKKNPVVTGFRLLRERLNTCLRTPTNSSIELAVLQRPGIPPNTTNISPTLTPAPSGPRRSHTTLSRSTLSTSSRFPLPSDRVGNGSSTRACLTDGAAFSGNGDVSAPSIPGRNGQQTDSTPASPRHPLLHLFTRRPQVPTRLVPMFLVWRFAEYAKDEAQDRSYRLPGLEVRMEDILDLIKSLNKVRTRWAPFRNRYLSSLQNRSKKPC